MKQMLSFLCSVVMGVALFSGQAEGADHINWLTNYEEAVNIAKSSSKPIVLFFTGSDWCSWCTKLDHESLDTREFAQAVGDKFVFVKLDFPVNSTLPPQVASQNKLLQKKFNVRGFPTIVILDSQTQTQIGTTGYRAGGGRAYADHLSKIVSDHSGYQQKMQSMGSQKYSSAELKKLYETAQMFGYDNDINHIIKAGMVSDDSLFFMIERYRMMATEGFLATPEAQSLKQQLIDLDPANEKMAQYQIALISFEANHETMDKEKRSPEVAVAPLIDYINKFGSKDKENLWRLEMIISQVYFDNNNLDTALKFAENSFNSAPPSAKAEISMAVKSIQSQISTSETALVN
jgi:protein disulfide-isomerase